MSTSGAGGASLRRPAAAPGAHRLRGLPPPRALPAEGPLLRPHGGHHPRRLRPLRGPHAAGRALQARTPTHRAALSASFPQRLRPPFTRARPRFPPPRPAQPTRPARIPAALPSQVQPLGALEPGNARAVAAGDLHRRRERRGVPMGELLCAPRPHPRPACAATPSCARGKPPGGPVLLTFAAATAPPRPRRRRLGEQLPGVPVALHRLVHRHRRGGGRRGAAAAVGQRQRVPVQAGGGRGRVDWVQARTSGCPSEITPRLLGAR